MADLTRINDILADVLEATHHQVDDEAAREFLLAICAAEIRLEQRAVPAGLVPPLMAAALGQFIGDQKHCTPKERHDGLRLAIGIVFHAFNLSSGGEADALIRRFSKPARRPRR